MTDQITTRDVGLSIAKLIEYGIIWKWSDTGPVFREMARGEAILDNVDTDDPDNLVIRTDSGKEFTIRIIAGRK